MRVFTYSVMYFSLGVWNYYLSSQPYYIISHCTIPANAICISSTFNGWGVMLPPPPLPSNLPPSESYRPHPQPLHHSDFSQLLEPSKVLSAGEIQRTLFEMSSIFGFAWWVRFTIVEPRLVGITSSIFQ